MDQRGLQLRNQFEGGPLAFLKGGGIYVYPAQAELAGALYGRVKVLTEGRTMQAGEASEVAFALEGEVDVRRYIKFLRPWTGSRLPG